MTTTARHLLIVGASGVIGSSALEHFGRLPGWTVTALSRRRPVVSPDIVFTHAAVDLADANACSQAVAAMPQVTHLLYAAVKEAPGLVSGWSDDDLIAENGRMFEHILDPLAASGHLAHLVLLQGTKAYGAHRHAVNVPPREDQPRDDHANFYWLHEDHARMRGAQSGFAFTIFRPQVLMGSAPGVAMNPVLALAAYAALCRETGRAFAFPGAENALMEVTDSALLAEATAWAFDDHRARDQIFNVTNGDIFVPYHAWDMIAAHVGLPNGGLASHDFATFFDDPGMVAAWRDLARRHDLLIDDLPSFLGESHHYADLLLGSRLSEKRVPVLLSSIKVRKAGFHSCRDSLEGLLYWMDRMVALKLVPPLG